MNGLANTYSNLYPIYQTRKNELNKMKQAAAKGSSLSQHVTGESDW